MIPEFGCLENLTIDPESTGKLIRAHLRASGCRVVDLSDAMGFLVPQAVYKWLSGSSLPTLQNMVRLARYLGVTVDELLCVEGEVPELELSRGRAPGREAGREEREDPESSLSPHIGQLLPEEDYSSRAHIRPGCFGFFLRRSS